MVNFKNRALLSCAVVILILLPSSNAFPWSSQTHTFIAQKAGVPNPQYSNFPDLSRNENLSLLGAFHWHDAAPDTKVTPDYIDQY